ncbi:hypothetical protein FOA52_001186 [Chlamydomonas sp. UWO 241]|nr:hypothetical protein FOA52_001186 [Chlamydomonas sp. UWO 241]
MERTRRHVTAPRRFEEDEVYGGSAARGKLRRVYRPLKRKDITKALALHEVHLHWPEDRKWYRAHIEKIFFRKFTAYVHYPDDDTYEEIDLKELILAKHVAIIETRGVNAKLRRGEMPVDADTTGDVPAVEYDDSASESSGEDVGEADDWAVDESDLDEDDFDDDDDELSEGADEADEIDAREAAVAARRAAREARGDAHPKTSRSAHKQSMRQRQSSGLAQPQAKRLRPSGPPGAAGASHASGARGEAGPAGTHPHVDTYSDKLAAALMDKINGVMLADTGGSGGGGGGGGMRGAGGASTSTPVTRLAPSSAVKMPSAAKLPPAKPAQSDDDVRRKVRDQLTCALEVAAEEARKEAAPQHAVGNPADVGAELEAALFEFGGKSVSKEYKSKFRSLVFNLKDAANPELRARVLAKELPADKLVRMSALELASRDLADWRKSKAEEFSKGKFLDVETAAKFSTAAAVAAKASNDARGAEREVTGKGRDSPGRGGDDGAGAAHAAAAHAGTESAQAEGVGRSGGGGSGGGGVDEQQHVGGSSGVGMRMLGVSSMELGSEGSLAAELAATDRSATDMRDTGGVDKHRVTLAPAAAAAAGAPASSSAAASADDDYDPDDFADDALDDLSGVPPLMPPDYGAAGGSGGGGGDGGGAGGAGVPDLSPIVGEQDDLSGALHKQGVSLRPGDQVWQGCVRVPDTGDMSLRCVYVAGMGDLSSFLGPGPIDVKGTVRLEKFEPFLEELRTKSKSRTVTLALLRVPAAATMDPSLLSSSASSLAELASHYSGKGRTGVCHPLPGLEGYLLGRCTIARRLLVTARAVTPPHLAHLMPRGDTVGEGELLLALIHRKDFSASKLGIAPPLATPMHHSASMATPMHPYGSADMDHSWQDDGLGLHLVEVEETVARC